MIDWEREIDWWRQINCDLTRHAGELFFISLNTDWCEDVTDCKIHDFVYCDWISYIAQEDAHSWFELSVLLLIFENHHIAQAAKESEMTVLIKFAFQIDSN